MQNTCLKVVIYKQHLPATSKDIITQINGQLNNVPYDYIIAAEEMLSQVRLTKDTMRRVNGLIHVTFTQRIVSELIHEHSVEFCSIPSNTNCIRNEFGFKVPRYNQVGKQHTSNKTKRNQILIQSGTDKSIISLELKFRLFTNNWIDVSVRKNTHNSRYRYLTELSKILNLQFVPKRTDFHMDTWFCKLPVRFYVKIMEYQ